MSVRIDKINVRNLGPIREFNHEFRNVNLIFGLNEQGKTCLVEFMVKSIFRNSTMWNLRKWDSSGMIHVSGLEERTVSFSPSSLNKLEDYLNNQHLNLPNNISKLLIVKGADLNLLKNTPGGIDRSVLKEFLSGGTLLDEIENRISTTIQKAFIDNSIINGANRGELKKRIETKQNLDKIDDLFKLIDETLSRGKYQALKRSLENIKDQIARQKLAKCYRAFTLNRELETLEERLSRIPRERIDVLRNHHQTYQRIANEIRRFEKDRDDIQQECKHYNWLLKSESTYKDIMNRGSLKSPNWLLILSGILMVSSIYFLTQNILDGAIISIGFSSVVLFLFGLMNHQLLKRGGDMTEMNALKTEFKERFSIPLSGLPQLQETISRIEKTQQRLEFYTQELERHRSELDNTIQHINQIFYELLGKSVEREMWEPQMTDIVKKNKEIQDEIQRTKTNLTLLEVDPSDYKQEATRVEYSKNTVQQLEDERDTVQNQIDNEESKFNSLKQRISQETGNFGSSWDQLIDNLKEKRRQVSNEYCTLTSEILAKISVNTILNEFRDREEETIREGLSSDIVKKPLQVLTHKYHSYDLRDDILWVISDFDEYPLSQLSTAAIEQTLLSLRIGFAAHLLDNETLFLVLDDAFQHSDYQRREWLIDEILNLAENGWQIFYFCMDNHIRDLFKEKAQNTFGEKFSFITLNS